MYQFEPSEIVGLDALDKLEERAPSYTQSDLQYLKEKLLESSQHSS